MSTLCDIPGASDLAEASFDLATAPHMLLRMIEAFAGSRVEVVRNNQGVTNSRPPHGAPVCVFNPTNTSAEFLEREGYRHVARFVVFPSLRDPRWLLSRGSYAAMMASTKIYSPHRLTARLGKAGVQSLIRCGWCGAFGSDIVIASATALPIEEIVRQSTGESQPVFAMSLGRQAAVSKLTVQVMRRNGAVLGYCKLPLNDAANARVRTEAAIVDRLSAYPSVRPHIARVLYAGPCGQTFLMFQTPLEGKRGPLDFGELHRRFLRSLNEINSQELPIHAVIAIVEKLCKRAAKMLPEEWTSLVREVIGRSQREGLSTGVPCGVVHGDFAPWNTRVRGNDLLLFDWESAEWQAPSSWDYFHFHVQSSYLLRESRSEMPPAAGTLDHLLFLLYLVKTACQFAEERNHHGVSYIKNLLLSALSGRPTWFLAKGEAANGT